MYDQLEFQVLGIANKLSELRNHGEYVAHRTYLSYYVYLYSYNKYYVEVFATMAFNDIYSIDIAPKRNVNEMYLNDIQINTSLNF